MPIAWAQVPVRAEGHWRVVAGAGFAVAVVTGLVLLGVSLWGAGNYGSPRADRWLNVMTGLGATSAVLGFLGAAYLTARYGRRASISINAETSELSGGSVLIAARPEVKSVGLFRVKFHGTAGALIRVREVYAVEESVSRTGLWEGQYRLAAAIFGDREDRQFAESGETLRTTVLFRVPAPDGVIGWMVVVSIKAPSRLMPGASVAWGDKVFVRRPEPKTP